MRLISKTGEGSKLKKVQDKAKPPYQRSMKTNALSKEKNLNCSN
jgi:hypothetical protein